MSLSKCPFLAFGVAKLLSSRSEYVWVPYPGPGGLAQKMSRFPPFTNVPGQSTGSVRICRDVTDRRRLAQPEHDVLDALLTMAHVWVQSEFTSNCFR